MNPVPESSAPRPCSYLRGKHMYVPSQAANPAHAQGGVTGNDQAFYWCNKTLGSLGADDAAVHPTLCRPGRSCHEA